MRRAALVLCFLTASSAYAGTAYYVHSSPEAVVTDQNGTSFIVDFRYEKGFYGTLSQPTSPFLPASPDPKVYINEDMDHVGTGIYFDTRWLDGTTSMPPDILMQVSYYLHVGTQLKGLVGETSFENGKVVAKFSTQKPQGGRELISTLIGEPNSALGLSFVDALSRHFETRDPSFPNSSFLLNAQLHYDGTGNILAGTWLARFTVTGEFIPEPGVLALVCIAAPLIVSNVRRRLVE